MATQLQLRRGTNAQVTAFTGAEGEVSVNTTNDSLHIHDGSTAGGFELARADLNNVSDTDLNAALTGNTVSALTITTLTLGSTAITATGTEINLLDGVTATTAELNYVDGVTSAIQTQLDAKAPTANPTFTGSFTSPGIDDNADAIAITIDSSENVGIGTSSPSDFFSTANNLVVGSGSGSNGMTIYSGTGNIGNIFFADGTSGNAEYRGYFEYSHADDSLRIATAASEAMRINSSGNVGINNTSPIAALDVTGTDSAGSLTSLGDTVTRAAAVIRGSTHANGYGLYMGYGNSTTDAQYIQSTRASGSTAFPLLLNPYGGNVGIGTSSPNALVDLEDTTPTLRLTDDRNITWSGGETLGNIEFFSSDASASGAHVTGFIKNINDRTGGSTQVAGALTFGVADYNTAASEAMRIGSSGNVNIYGTDNRPLAITSFDTVSAGAGWDLDATSSNGVVTVSTGGSERMRIDSSGNLLVGHTSTNFNSVGHGLQAVGNAYHTRDGGNPLTLNRKTSDGNIIDVRKDNTTVGSWGNRGSTNSYISLGSSGLTGSGTGGGALLPTTGGGTYVDNVVDLGFSGARFDDIYATNDTIQTSDRNEKQDIEALSDAEQRVAVAAKGLLRKFRWISSVETKGDEARIHFGIIAQDLQDAFTAEGLDAGRYAMFIHTTWTDEETGEERSRMGVRYSELLAFIIAAI